MNSVLFTMLQILVCALVTFALRAIPFLIFAGRRMPPAVKKVADRLPPAIMGVLVIYCLKDFLFVSVGSNVIAAFVAILAVVGVHLWKKNTLVSIAVGTVIYMVLIRVLPLWGVFS